jgi:hypothetical protein
MRGATHFTSESMMAKQAVATRTQTMPRNTARPAAAAGAAVIVSSPIETSLLPASCPRLSLSPPDRFGNGIPHAVALFPPDVCARL